MSDRYHVELTGPHDSRDGSCMMCRITLDPDGEPKFNRRKVYELSLAMGNYTSTWRLCSEHIKEVRLALRGTIR